MASGLRKRRYVTLESFVRHAMRYDNHLIPLQVFLFSIASGVCLSAAGCVPKSSSQASLYQRLQSGQSNVLAEAIVQAGQDREMGAAPYLVNSLEHDEAGIRLLAIESLRRITGLDYGFRSYASQDNRRLAVEEWRQWLVRQSPPSATSEPEPAIHDTQTTTRGRHEE